MGLIKNLLPFDTFTIENKELILKMLKYEDELFLSDQGQQFLNEYGNNITSLDGSKSLQRLTLNKFGFKSEDSDLKNYRSIFNHYYNSPTDYNKDILNSVYYMRENRCLYYDTKPIKKNDIIPNVNIYNLDGKTKLDLYSIMRDKNFDKTLVCAFSLS